MPESSMSAGISAAMPAASPEPSRYLNTRQPIRWGAWIIGVGFGGFLLWTALVPLDEGVPTPGTVTVDTKRKAVQHQTGGIVREIYVREGEMVEAGQVLMKLYDGAVNAQFQTLRQHYLTLRAAESRLSAEQAGAASIRFHSDVLKDKDDPWVAELVLNQTRLFHARQAALSADLAAMRDSMQGQQGVLQGQEGSLIARKKQLALNQEHLAAIKDLVAEGYVPRIQQIDLERQGADLAATLSNLQGDMTRARSGIAELRSRINLRQQEYQKEVSTQLSDIRREVQADADRLQVAAVDVARTEIKAPVAGQVVGLAMQTVGGVIQGSQKLMEIVPKDEKLMLEARIPPNLIDRVRAGDMADIRFTNFVNTPQLVVEGRIVSLAKDAINDPSANVAMGPASYYLARVEVTENGLQTLGQRHLQPGMSVEIVVKTGQRSMLSYLIHPLVKRIAASMKEE